MTVAALATGYVAWRTSRIESTLLLGWVALLFNPISSFYLDRSTWLILDLVAAVLLAAGLRLNLERQPTSAP